MHEHAWSSGERHEDTSVVQQYLASMQCGSACSHILKDSSRRGEEEISHALNIVYANRTMWQAEKSVTEVCAIRKLSSLG